MAQKDLMIPFNNGSPVSWAHTRSEEIRSNEPFEATMRIIDFDRGRSSTVMVLIKKEDYTNYKNGDSKVPKYNVFVSDMMPIINKSNNGVVSGTWWFCKKGSNIGLQLKD